jgi:hypothetical protein
MNGKGIVTWLVAGILCSAFAAHAVSVTLAWDPPNPSDEVKGYRLYYGLADAPGDQWYTEVKDAFAEMQYRIDGLTPGATYIFAVQAYGDDGRTSDFSDKIRYVAAEDGPQASFPRVLAVDSQETVGENGTGGNALDGNPRTYWHTQWSGQAPPPPHYIILDLGAPHTVHGLRYLPRQDGRLNGTIVRYEVYLSLDPNQWDPTVWISGSWEPTANEKIVVQSSGQHGRYLKLVGKEAADGGPWTSAAEIQVIGTLP